MIAHASAFSDITAVATNVLAIKYRTGLTPEMAAAASAEPKLPGYGDDGLIDITSDEPLFVPVSG